jgi:wobble nucleotide-excising tRNase
LLGLWEKGLEIASTDEQCPLCEEPTFTDRRKEELRRRLAATEQTLSLTRQLAAAKDTAVGLLRQAKTATSRLAVRALTTEDRNQLTRLYADNPTQLQAFLSTYDTLSNAFAKYTSETDSCDTFLEQVASRIENAADAPAIVAEVADLQIRTTPALSAVADALSQYQADWAQFQPTLAARIASNELVSKIDTVGQTLRDVEPMRVVAQHERILNDTQTLIRTIEASIQQTQTQLLTTRGAEVKALYDRLNRGANVAFDVMEPGTDTMKLHATSFGVRMPAAANLSECQLNCVGLAMWLMRATTPTSPFGFIMLDDPVQSMDDDHAEAFIADIVPHLMDDHGKQVLILSHVKRVTDRLRDLHQNRLTRVYHLDTFDSIGPTITEQIRLRMLLAEIKGAARGNESNREYAVDRIRVLVEHLIREMHLQITGQPAPPRFDRANASQLLPLFQTLAGTTQQEHAGLRDTIGFCDPAHHTEVGYSVPLTSNIQPHIDRMEGLLNKYRL